MKITANTTVGEMVEYCDKRKGDCYCWQDCVLYDNDFCDYNCNFTPDLWKYDDE